MLIYLILGDAHGFEVFENMLNGGIREIDAGGVCSLAILGLSIDGYVLWW